MGEKSRDNFQPGAKMSKELLKDLEKHKKEKEKKIDKEDSKPLKQNHLKRKEGK